MTSVVRRYKLSITAALAFGVGFGLQSYLEKPSISAWLNSTNALFEWGFNKVSCDSTLAGKWSYHILPKIGYPGRDNVRFREGYVLQYDTKHRTAHWVCEYLTPERLKIHNGQRSENFQEDSMDHPFWRAKLTDYRRSGFDRGHLAPAGDHRVSQRDIDDTFFLSNMSPQVGAGFNRDYWANLEQYVRSLTFNSGETFVFTGPLYLSHQEADGKSYVKYQVIGHTPVAVPTHFFKVILVNSENTSISNKPIEACSYRIEAYILPNQRIDDKIPLSSFKVPLQEVERYSGFLYFDKLGDARYSHQ